MSYARNSYQPERGLSPVELLQLADGRWVAKVGKRSKFTAEWEADTREEALLGLIRILWQALKFVSKETPS